MATVRKLIVGCDGTWNDTDDQSALTNVAKLLNACSSRDQITHFEEGVGTAHWEALPGGIYGKGLDRQILGAYRFLSRRFADQDWERENNKVYIFGFSRGAYAARRLAGLISQCGVPKMAKDIQLAWQLYLRRDAASVEALKADGRLFDISIEMLGVWDTVKTTTDEDFDDQKLPKCVVKGFHAMAIDEKRKFFPILEWDAEERVHQTWFTGVHADVGGGYKESGLSDIALQWMVDRAHGQGMRFKASAISSLKKDPCGVLHDSFDGIWKAFGKRERNIPKSAKIHPSTQERVEKLVDYKPANLPELPNYQI